MIKPTLDEFRERAKRGNLVPVYQEILADLETPVSVYRKLATSEHSFLLESVENGEQLGRYSFLGADPLLIFTCRGNDQALDAQPGPPDVVTGDTPIDTLRNIMAAYKPVEDPSLPPFTGGAVGYMAHDAVRYFENIPDSNPDELGVPDGYFMVADTLVAFDHVKRRMVLIANAHVGTDGPDAAYEAACQRIDALRERLRQPAPPQKAPARPPRKLEPKHNFTQAEYEDVVRRAKEYIAAGDIFQVVPSQRIGVDITCDPFDIYRAQRAINPSPYMFYLRCGEDIAIAGSSPEILVRCDSHGRVTLRPIAGTRPRGATPEEDKALEEDLLADGKEIAEHIMLVDLGRNDVGRVCKYGTVAVDRFKFIERYSHVMHIVSNVVGELEDGKDAIDVLGAAFPAGTLTGAPKIRAMEIIDELENVRRNIYGGAVVYFGFGGAMDSAITIRTAVIRGGKAYAQAGGGVVADSDPAAEWQETMNKARSVLRAIEWAENGLE